MNSDFLTTALEACSRAENILKKYFNQMEIRWKKDGSPVCMADIKAEEIIRKTILAKFPNHKFWGEEQGKNSYSESNYLWIIDPLDGTKNYIRGIGLFSTQIALYYQGEIILGLSNAPDLSEKIYAEKGKGAYLNGKKINVSTISELNRAYLGYGNYKYFVKNKKTKQLSKIIKATASQRGAGDFWNYHLLSCGKIDITIEAETKIWDIAALSLIVEEAGGKTTDIEGKKIDLFSSSIIAANKNLHSQVIKIFNEN